MTAVDARFPYPRRRVARAVLRGLTHLAFVLLTDLHVTGEENLPSRGPLLIVANHFSAIDPVAVIRAVPWPIEFLGGFRMPFAPPSLTWIPKLWGYYAVHRGAASRDALRAGESVLAQGGVLGVFPEAGNWAAVLRPPRPGAAFLAARSGARILPVGLDGLLDVFPSLRRGRRAQATVRIGRPFGPFRATGQGRERRRQLDHIGHQIMRQIAELIPAERRGHYSEDPALRAEAQSMAYPWADNPDV
jgi:1-acyl-sn-glycerol-3-phosphate acyltransferase